MRLPEVDEGVVGEVEVAHFSGGVDGVVDLVEVVWVGQGVLLLKEAHAIMKSVRAKIAARMVQQQSVHILSFSSTGRFRKV